MDFAEHEPAFGWLDSLSRKRECHSSELKLTSLSSSSVFRLRGSLPLQPSSSIPFSPLIRNIISAFFIMIIIFILSLSSYSLDLRLKELKSIDKRLNDSNNACDNEDINRITHYIIENVEDKDIVKDDCPANKIDRVNTTNESDNESSDSSEAILKRLDVYGLSTDSPSNLSDITDDEDCNELTNRLKSYGVPTSKYDSPSNMSENTNDDFEFKLDDIDLKPAALRKVNFTR